jgi:hypothetical protein
MTVLDSPFHRENVFGELPTSALFWSVSARDPVTTSRFYP